MLRSNNKSYYVSVFVGFFFKVLEHLLHSLYLWSKSFQQFPPLWLIKLLNSVLSSHIPIKYISSISGADSPICPWRRWFGISGEVSLGWADWYVRGWGFERASTPMKAVVISSSLTLPRTAFVHKSWIRIFAWTTNRLTRPNGWNILATFPTINLSVRMLPNAGVGTKKRKHILAHTTEFQGCLSIARCHGWGWFLVLCAPGEWLIATSESYLTIYKPSFLLHSTDLEVLWTTGLHHHCLSLNPKKHPCMLTFSQFQRQADILSSTSRHFPETQTGHETEWMHLQKWCIQICVHRYFHQLLNFSKEI